jgi:hypothetical protein
MTRISFPVSIEVNDEGFARDRLIECMVCYKVLGYNQWWGDLRTEGYLDSDMISTCWNFTANYCPECYSKEMENRHKESIEQHNRESYEVNQAAKRIAERNAKELK